MQAIPQTILTHTFRSTSSGRSTTQSPSLGSSSTGHFTTQSTSLGSSSTATSGSFDAHKGHRKDSSLSTGAIIGICAAAIVVILIVVGVVVYWKKYHHRSRLRAAYYNDISMHDPLYEDFGGPEVAISRK
ncbi:hypothetical protein OS493_026829 [Desmophyllum pertusum]|uniref:Cytochrome b561 domain-containing protein n=1 Tax=Desmophyllum pertusum TaxID=174260 RepID=A0A9W9ZL02_9CNID|nr:hypothetical protein OS493_026829 [Desmophyllum pertusum]